LKALLDTHAFCGGFPMILSCLYVREIIYAGSNELFFSAAGCWEIAIKAQLGMLSLPDKPDVFISEQLS
jgi:PIN domain nuclease of toxin-antitoxin system